MKRRILAAAAMTLAMLVPSLGHTESDEKNGSQQADRSPSVVLTVDYGDGVQKRFPAIPWSDKMTVLSALDWGSRHPRGIDFQRQGRASTAMVTQIDDLKNRGGNKRNWVFRVNGKLGERSCGVSAVKAGDRILWKFERYR